MYKLARSRNGNPGRKLHASSGKYLSFANHYLSRNQRNPDNRSRSFEPKCSRAQFPTKKRTEKVHDLTLKFEGISFLSLFPEEQVDPFKGAAECATVGIIQEVLLHLKF